MSKGLTDIITRHQVLLEGYKGGAYKNYLRLSNKLENELIAEASKLGVESVNQLTKKQLNGFVSNMNGITKLRQAEMLDDLTGDLSDLARSESLFEQEILNTVIKSKDVVAKSAAAKAFTLAASTPITATGQMLDPFLKGWSATKLKQVEGVVRNGYKEGQTLNQMVQKIRGTKANNYKDGITNLGNRQAEAVVRTSVQHVSSTARNATWDANKDIVKGKKWVSTLDGRTTQVCRSLDGKEWKVGFGPSPPIHIGCRSTTVPVLADDLELDFLDEGATRSALGGEVPANQTYYDWLKGQPTGFQEVAIGKQRTKWLNDGKLTSLQFSKLNLNKNFRPLTLKEMESKRDVIISGNLKKSKKGQALIDKEYPRANPRGKDSLARFMSNGVLTKERKILHDEIVDNFFSGTKPVSNPIASMTGGGPASGKSVLFTTGKVKNLKNAVTVDSDEIKKFLPEYNLKTKFGDAKAAAFAHEESSFLAKRIVNEAAKKKHNIFLDGTGDSSFEKLKKKALKMRQGGAKLQANYVTVDTSEAVRRNVERFKKTGRMVPNEFVQETHANISKILPQALEEKIFDEVTLWDTNTRNKTIKVMSQKKGITKIHNQKLWDRFLLKVNDFTPE